MPYYSPLRYPGGKRRLTAAVSQVLDANGLTDIDYVEPYAGGAAVALDLLFEERASRVHINDLDRAVYAFWHSILNATDELCHRIESTAVTIPEWKRQREVYARRSRARLLDLGFAAFFLNRVNRSGILSGGVIGGIDQAGAWKIDARFNKQNLVKRIRRIARYRSRIRIANHDAMEFVKDLTPKLGPRSFIFFDPPYMENGDDLYLNEYGLEDHRRLAEQISKLDGHWIVTYDRAAVREDLFPGLRRLSYGLNYSAQARYEGKEVMFLSDSLDMPESWTNQPGVVRLSREGSAYPLVGCMETPRG